jgi:hypothetical protein
VNQPWWEAFKYGPTVLAALAALWTAGLLTIELQRKNMRSQAKNLLIVFMGFCLLLVALSYGLTILEANPLISGALGELDGNLASKQGLLGGLNDVAPSERGQLNGYVLRMCKDVAHIATAINAELPDNCRIMLSQQH